VSPEVRESLMKAEEALKQTRADVRLVERENLHFTVKFLGEIPESMVEEVDRRVKTLALRRMEVDVRGMGAFPDARRPRVVWAGVSPHDLASISSSGQQVIDALEGIGESDERGFHPHITLARVRSPRNLEALASMLRDYATRDFGRTPIAALKLKASTLTPGGPIYRDIKEFTLQ
jgi:RNA 2',3'-cyclic 3'-phosphodiesterase